MDFRDKVDIKKMHNNLYLYGAGIVGKGLFNELEHIGVQVQAFLITKGKNEREFEGVPIVCIDEIEILEPASIVLAVGEKYKEEIKEKLRLLDYLKYVQEINIYDIRSIYILKLIKDSNLSIIPETGIEMSYEVIEDKQSDFRCRFLKDEYIYNESIKNELEKGELPKNFRDIFGDFLMIRKDNQLHDKYVSNSCKILVATCHKDHYERNIVEDDIFTPIQVGRALTNVSTQELTDNVGYSISERNYNYCECTALYSMWKNQLFKEVNYIGLCHYRRRIRLSKVQMHSLDYQGIDMVFTIPTYISDIEAHFSMCTKNTEAWEVLRQAIYKVASRYKEAFDIFERQHFVCQCNISIMRRDIFDEYCEFIFPVLEYVENYYLERVDRRDRYLGYLAEPLLSVFALKHKNEYKIAYENMEYYKGD